MKEVRYTLLSEGTSDKALLPILNWLLQFHLPEYAVQDAWADLSQLQEPLKTLEKRIESSVEYYPCHILFVHRDSDNQGRNQRLHEINSAVSKTREMGNILHIPVIPVRMTEAWLLFDELAIREAAGNPKGTQKLSIPKLKNVENIADPKTQLNDLIKQASGVSGKRLKRLNRELSQRVQRISAITEDFSPLRELEAFEELEKLIRDFSTIFKHQHGSNRSRRDRS